MKKVADYIIAAMLEESKPLYVTSSIGICVPIVESLEAKMKIADEHLYKAKNGGRNRVEFLQPRRGARAVCSVLIA